LLVFTSDPFKGITIQHNALPQHSIEVTRALTELIECAKKEEKRLIWLTLSIERADVIPIATELGFVFHNCQEKEITLICRLVEDAYAPFVPTHSIGAGALIINDKNQVLVIREKLAMGPGYKLPGGHIELGEDINSAIEREVFEETGVKANFQEIVGFASKHPYRFDKSNIYFVCSLVALDQQIDIQDTDEIEDARWIDLDVYINDPENSQINRELVKELSQAKGLQLVELDFTLNTNEKRQVFMAQ
jgi:mutator protein MutT